MNLFRLNNGNSTNHKSTERVLLLIPLVLACFTLLPAAKAALGTHDTADGTGALASESGGDFNSAFGFDALNTNTTGFDNTATGAFALDLNTTGFDNTANGVDALKANTTGNSNTANGAFALKANTTGFSNTATGFNALLNNTTGSDNTANGAGALDLNTTGFDNTADGVSALFSNTTGISNTANGVGALGGNTTGSNNVAIGINAGSNLTTGSSNVCIGAGVFGVAGESNTTRIKNIYFSHATARAVYVDSDNKLGTLSSSRRYKEEIQPMDKASETLFELKPVTFRYKKEIDPAHALSFGLIAEQVAKVDPDLITRDEEGKPETVRYEAVNAMLLNEFLKEHRSVQELKKEIAALTATVKQQAAQIQKVSAQLAVSKPAPQTVLNQ